MTRLAFLLVGSFLAGTFTMSSDAWAWGDQGHKVVCEIAMRLVQPNTRAERQKLISTDDRFDSFSAACTWPDPTAGQNRDPVEPVAATR